MKLRVHFREGYLLHARQMEGHPGRVGSRRLALVQRSRTCSATHGRLMEEQFKKLPCLLSPQVRVLCSNALRAFPGFIVRDLITASVTSPLRRRNLNPSWGLLVEGTEDYIEGLEGVSNLADGWYHLRAEP